MPDTSTATLGQLNEVLARVAEVVRDVVAPEAAAVDAEARWPERGLRALQEAGLGGLVVPGDLGGFGQRLYGLVRVCELIGQACPSTALCFGMHCVGTAVIGAKATDDQQRRYLEPIARGEHLTTIALSEPGSGAHFYFPQTRLARADGTYRIDGEKSFVTSGGHADSYVVSTITTVPNRPVGEFSCVMLPAGTDGMRWGTPWDGLGMRGNASRHLTLDGVVIPEEELLGEEGDQIWYLFQVVAPYFLCAMAGTYLGAAGAAVEEVTGHLQRRVHGHSGRSLGQIGVLQHRLGELWSMVARTRRLVYWAAQEADAGGPETLPALCSAKADVAECAVDVVNESMTLMGGRAYGRDGRMGRLLRDVRAAHVMTPTTDILRTWTGRALLGLPLLGD